jgi:hypothetical protein
MLWAADGEARESGALSTCQSCSRPVRAKCGQLVVWHWAHVAGADCDRWSEPETEWHKEWKSAAPEDRREVTIGDHRADILTASGHVVEVQHSGISLKTIAERDEFYEARTGKALFWIVDASSSEKPTFYPGHCIRRPGEPMRSAPWRTGPSCRVVASERVWSCLDCGLMTERPSCLRCSACGFVVECSPCLCATRRSRFTGTFDLSFKPSFFLVADEGRLLLDYGDEVLVVHGLFSGSEARTRWRGWGSLVPRALVLERIAEDRDEAKEAA